MWIEYAVHINNSTLYFCTCTTKLVRAWQKRKEPVSSNRWIRQERRPLRASFEHIFRFTSSTVCNGCGRPSESDCDDGFDYFMCLRYNRSCQYRPTVSRWPNKNRKSIPVQTGEEVRDKREKCNQNKMVDDDFTALRHIEPPTEIYGRVYKIFDTHKYILVRGR